MFAWTIASAASCQSSEVNSTNQNEVKGKYVKKYTEVLSINSKVAAKSIFSVFLYLSLKKK